MTIIQTPQGVDLRGVVIGRHAQVLTPEALNFFAALHRDFPADSATAFHVRRVAAGENGVLVVMQEK